jgi:uncharacterized membrane protein SirB2
MSLLTFFQWCEKSAIGDTIRQSHWLFPVIEAIHLLGLGLIGGAVLVVDLALLGGGLGRQHSIAQLSKDAEPWLIGGLALMFTTGIPLFLSESIKCYYSVAFWVKMTALFSVIVLTFTVQRRVARMADSRPLLFRFLALVSLILWAAVGWGGRWIGFS